MKQTILVTGATGKVGREVVTDLLAKDVKIKVGVRSLRKIKYEPWINNVEVVALDYEQPETLKNALANVNKLFLVTPPGNFHEYTVSKSMLKHGEKQGLQHIVRLSAIDAEKHNFEHQKADSLLLSSNIDYTALQPNHFMQNFFTYQTSIREQHKIIDPVGSGKISFIDTRDIASVAATILTEPGHVNQLYQLTGGEAFDYNQVAKLFSDILDYEITYQPVSTQEFIQGMSADIAEPVTRLFQLMQNGEYAHVHSTVEKILARPPITLKQFITDYRDKFNYPKNKLFQKA